MITRAFALCVTTTAMAMYAVSAFDRGGTVVDQPIGIARIDLSYKYEEIHFVTKDVAYSHCSKLIKTILQSKGIFMQMSSCALSLDINTGCFGNLYFDDDYQQVDQNIADAIGNLWCKKITGGMGSYRNFDAGPLYQIELEVINPLNQRQQHLG